MFCPSCGCGVLFHDAVNRYGHEVLAHCENCGPCWKTVNTKFLRAVQEKLGA
jgi:uncharacterized Zn finger protein